MVLSAVYDGRLLMKLLQLSVWSMLHAFISVAPWFLFFVAIVTFWGKTELAFPILPGVCSTLFFVIVNSFASYYRIVSQQSDRGRTGEGTFSCLFAKFSVLGYMVGFH